VACSLDLLRELREELGSRFLDVLVADALYLQAPFVKEIEGLGLDWVIAEALTVLTMIRVLAYTLTLVFFSGKCAATPETVRSVFAT